MNQTTSPSGSPSTGAPQSFVSLTLLYQRLILTEEEINEICKGLKSNAAKIRALRRLNIKVYRKPDGSPLVFRIDLLNLFFLPNEASHVVSTSKIEPKWLKRH